jgi:aryl-alcohol dehydrogenase-like predicted oxidoreductase
LYNVDSDSDVVDRVKELAATRKTSPARIALAWLLQKEYLTAPIIGATKMEHLEDAVGALEVKLSPDEVNMLEELYVPHKVLGHL